MSNHVYLIACCKPEFQLAGIMCDLKKFTGNKIEEAIRQNVFKSRRTACPYRSGGACGCLKEQVKKTAIINISNVGSKVIIL